MQTQTFQNPNPATGTPGTLVTTEWFQSVTDEIVNVVQEVGLTPSSDSTQLWQSILEMTGRALTRTVFYQGNAGANAPTKTETFTVPTGCFVVQIDAFAPGGGGGAGGGNSSASPGAGGGGGAGASVQRFRLPVSPGDVVTLTIEAPGVGGINNGLSGTSAGNLIIELNSATVLTLGGGNGASNSTEGTQAVGAAGGVATWATGYSGMALWGGGGGAGIYISSVTAFGGSGGAPFGGQGEVQTTGSNTAGLNAAAYGTGGSGGSGTSSGGNGAPGAIWLTY